MQVPVWLGKLLVKCGICSLGIQCTVCGAFINNCTDTEADRWIENHVKFFHHEMMELTKT